VLGELMCSTPRPKRNLKAGTAGASSSGTILSDLSAQKRAEFVKRANSADERRYQLKQQIAAKTHKAISPTEKITSLLKNKNVKQKTKSWHYWLLDASMKELFMLLFLGKSY
jgi:hypothetical protein